MSPAPFRRDRESHTAARAAQPIEIRPRYFAGSEEEVIRDLFSVPAYIRRARDLEGAEAALDDKLRRMWMELVRPVAVEMVYLTAEFGDEASLSAFLEAAGSRTRPAFEEVRRLVSDHPDFPRLKPVRLLPDLLFAPSKAGRLSRLAAAVRRFNAEWPAAVAAMDLEPINGQIDSYNRWYPLERECALRHNARAFGDFRPKARLSPEDLAVRLPLLPELD
jgi:hypothetical protein